jgi:hypothetical protein
MPTASGPVGLELIKKNTMTVSQLRAHFCFWLFADIPTGTQKRPLSPESGHYFSDVRFSPNFVCL